MAPQKQPKVLLFDIGGVCVVSPFQAILDYELANSIPPGWVNFAISAKSPNGMWQQLERGEVQMNADWFAGFNADLRDRSIWAKFYGARHAALGLPAERPSVPDVDAEALFWEMMRTSRAPDPWMWPALQALKASGRYIVAALSNTLIFPPEHPYSQPSASVPDVRGCFDVFVSSAHVGLRKPDPRIYELAVKMLNDHQPGADIRPADVVFLDDIGENLKAAKTAGFGTIKVPLGRTFEAVDELEELTGLKLAGNHPRVPVTPKAKL